MPPAGQIKSVFSARVMAKDVLKLYYEILGIDADP
jgi:hypothetical protein